MRIIYIFSVFVICLILSCRPKYNQKPIYSTLNNFETVVGWMETPSNNSHTITNEDSHSGKYSSKVDKNNHFSYFFKGKLKDISENKINWVKISFYCKLKSEYINKTSLACFIQDDKANIINWSEENLKIHLLGNKNKWVYVEKNFNISDFSKPELTLGAFVWNNVEQNEEVLIDDLKIDFFK